MGPQRRVFGPRALHYLIRAQGTMQMRCAEDRPEASACLCAGKLARPRRLWEANGSVDISKTPSTTALIIQGLLDQPAEEIALPSLALIAARQRRPRRSDYWPYKSEAAGSDPLAVRTAMREPPLDLAGSGERSARMKGQAMELWVRIETHLSLCQQAHHCCSCKRECELRYTATAIT